MRILVLNNYDLNETWRKVRARQLPDQLLYGINHFADAGHTVEIAPLNGDPKWSPRDAWLRRHHLHFFTGSLEQQRTAWTRRGSFEILYAPCQTQTQALAVLRRFRMFRMPMVVLVHHPFTAGRLNRIFRPYIRAMLRGIDQKPALAADVARGIDTITGAPGSSVFIPWGPDADFYPRDEGALHNGVIATGFSGRDFATFIRGARQAPGLPVEVITSAECLPEQPDPLPGHIRFRESRHFDEAMRDMLCRATTVAIPLKAGPLLAGLSLLNDALGFGKAVLMTRHPLIPLDIEKEGIGLWVEPGDAEGWTRALAFVRDHPEEMAAMGRRARAIVDHGYHSRAFAARMLEIFEKALHKDKAHG